MIDDSSLSVIVLTFCGGLFLLTTFIKSALSTITRESVVAWKNEDRNGSGKLEKLFKMTDQYMSTFAMLKILALGGCLIPATLLFAIGTTSRINVGDALIVTLLTLFVMGVIETFIRAATKKKGQAA